MLFDPKDMFATSQRAIKTTVLSSIQWAMAIVLSALTFAGIKGAPFFILVTLLITFCLLIIVFVGFYAYFAFKNPTMLRTENYQLITTAMDKGLIGDSSGGIKEYVVRDADSEAQEKLEAKGRSE